MGLDSAESAGDSTGAQQPAALVDHGANGAVVRCQGDWRVAHAARLEETLSGLLPGLCGDSGVQLDISAIGRMDTSGAWLLHDFVRKAADQGTAVTLTGADGDQQSLLDLVADHDTRAEAAVRERLTMADMLARFGERTQHGIEGSLRGINFVGRVLYVLARSLMNPRRLRFTSLVYHMEYVGVRALPILGLTCFLIGVVIEYQGAFTLRQFGAEIWVVGLVAISIMRELGILIVAVILAGRSGSAFTAEIGSMRLHEEIDAMHVLGLDEIEILVLPRFLALLIVMPVLTFFGDIMGLLGGAIMASAAHDISYTMFIEQMLENVTGWDFGVGLIKAPVFAAVIALCGCYEGLRVSGSAESVGHHTTKAVVETIFLVIVLDAFFAIFFSEIGI